MSDDQTPFWFTESDLPNGKTGLRLSSLITDVIYEEQTPFGKLQIFDTAFYGRMLVLDGIIQTTVSDEFIYHEMMVTAPAAYHGNVKSALIIGGGDGGAIKQALRLPGIATVAMVEIDTKVIELCRQYMPELSDGAFDDPKVELIVTDGKEFLETTDRSFDLIVLDLTDPVPGSPAEALFTPDFYTTVKQRLHPGGIISVQCGSLLFQPGEVGGIKRSLETLFEHTMLHNAAVPGYQLSLFGFLYASDGQAQLDESLPDWFGAVHGLRYLNTDTFLASKAIPPYLLDEINAPAV